MAKKPTRANKQWTQNEETALAVLAAKNTPTRVIGLKMARTPDAIYAKASELSISLKPPNQRPYGRAR